MGNEQTNLREREFCIECFVLDSRYSRNRGGSILLQGPAKVGKSVFCRNFVRRAFEKRRIIYVSTDESPGELLAQFESILGSSPEPDRLRLVDAYCSRTGVKSSLSGVLHIESTSNLNELSVTLQEALKDLARPLIIFDNLDALVLDAGEDSTIKFVRSTLPKLLGQKAFSLFTISEGLHSEKFINTLRSIFDGIIEMRLDEENDEIHRSIRLFAMKGEQTVSGWLPYTINKKGIDVKRPRKKTHIHGSAVAS
ncbi:MAG: RAD55 family ATPase [Candidatus Bathyarchaeia archaeon]